MVYKDKKLGTWYVSSYYIDWTGERKRKVKRGFHTKKEAQEWEDHFMHNQAPSIDMSFEDFWKTYERDVKPKLRRNTWETKQYVVENKILPYLGKRKMNEIKPTDIIQWQNVLRTALNEKGEAYKGTYLRKCQAELSAIFNHAVKYYELKNNPVRIAGPMGVDNTDEMQFWTKEEYLQFVVEIADKEISYYAFEVLYWCGLRMGELMALTKADIDFENNTIHITKSLQRLHGEVVITPPKTKKSVRIVQMHDELANELRVYVDSLYGVEDDDRIFPITKGYLHHEMERGAKLAGVKKIRIHDLRHSHVSLLISMGFTAVEIGNRVGHESEKITYRYAHMFPNAQSEMAKRLNNQWKEAFDVGEENGPEEQMAQ